MIDFYNLEADRFDKAHGGAQRKERQAAVDSFVEADQTKIAWTVNLKQELVRGRRFAVDPSCLVPGIYRPFNRQWLYFNRRLNERVLQMPKFFPDAGAENVVIGVSASDSRSAYSVFISDHVASLHAVDMVGSQYFPLYLYDEMNAPQQDDEERPSGTREQASLFSENSGDLFEAATSQPGKPCYKRRDALTDEGLAHFQAAYFGETLSKEDVFYYVYGLLHAPDYRERFADNLGKELPRIPCVKSAADFRAFSQAGRELGALHLNYEIVEMYPATVASGTTPLTPADYRVEKMRHGKNGKDKDLSTVHYNARITVSGIPLEAYEYVVNGKPAIDWVMERQCVKTDKASGIVNDANDWAVETMNNPRYPLELLLRVVTVSVETMKLVKALPRLDV